MTETETSTVSPRVARRRVETRARLLSIAARLFAKRSFDGVRLDEIADEADIARGTLYSHFSSKEELLRAIVQPVLERAVECLQRIPETLPPRQAVEELLRAYLGLWRMGPDAMRLAHRFDAGLPKDLFTFHEVHVRQVVGILRRASEAGLLRLGDPGLSARVFASTAVPVLEIVSGDSQAEKLFLEAMSGLLLRPGL
ncbi:MAG: TetR/AcrR family transcriptional regulator [Myxococcales bacterium]